MALRAKRGLEVDAEHRRVAQPELHDRADLALVDASLDSGDQHYPHVGFGQAVQRAELLLHQVAPAAQCKVRRALEAVELQIDVGLEPLETGQQPVVVSDLQPVGVDHHVADSLLLGQLDEVQQVGMKCRLAARELQHLRVALRLDVAIQHEVDLLSRELEPCLRQVRSGIGKTQRAVQVACGVDLDQRQAGVLTVLGAQPAVMWTALPHLGCELQRDRPRLVEACDLRVEVCVAEDQGFKPAMIRAPLAHDHAPITKQDLSVDHTPAFRAEAACELPEDLWPIRLHLMLRWIPRNANPAPATMTMAPMIHTTTAPPRPPPPAAKPA